MKSSAYITANIWVIKVARRQLKPAGRRLQQYTKHTAAAALLSNCSLVAATESSQHLELHYYSVRHRALAELMALATLVGKLRSDSTPPGV